MFSHKSAQENNKVVLKDDVLCLCSFWFFLFLLQHSFHFPVPQTMIKDWPCLLALCIPSAAAATVRLSNLCFFSHVGASVLPGHLKHSAGLGILVVTVGGVESLVGGHVLDNVLASPGGALNKTTSDVTKADDGV
jgi:hypothetical protein